MLGRGGNGYFVSRNLLLNLRAESSGNARVASGPKRSLNPFTNNIPAGLSTHSNDELFDTGLFRASRSRRPLPLRNEGDERGIAESGGRPPAQYPQCDDPQPLHRHGDGFLYHGSDTELLGIDGDGGELRERRIDDAGTVDGRNHGRQRGHHVHGLDHSPFRLQGRHLGLRPATDRPGGAASVLQEKQDEIDR